MANNPLPPLEAIRNAITYDLQAGSLTWLPRTPDQFSVSGRKSAKSCCQTWNTRFAGQRAFNTRSTTGYLGGNFQSRFIHAHRVLWALHKGEWPTGEIDHINCVRDDNRLLNLREVTGSENLRNRVHKYRGEDEYVGVYPARDKYRAVINAETHRIHLGYFDTKRDAAIARDMAARLIDGQYARVNLRGV